MNFVYNSEIHTLILLTYSAGGSHGAMFDLDISPSTFPEMYMGRPNVCNVCTNVRKLIHNRCVGDAAVPGRGAEDAHLLIMLVEKIERQLPIKKTYYVN